MVWKWEPGPEPHSDDGSGRRNKTGLGLRGIAYVDLHLCGTWLFCPGLDSHTILRYEERKGEKTEDTVSTICLEPNPGVTGEFFLIKHYFLVSSESLRNQILFELHEPIS